MFGGQQASAQPLTGKVSAFVDSAVAEGKRRRLQQRDYLKCVRACVCAKGGVSGGKIQASETFCLQSSCSSVIGHPYFLCPHGQTRGRTVSLRLSLFDLTFFFINLAPYFRKSAWSGVPMQHSFCANFTISVWTCPCTTPTTAAVVHTTVLATQRSHPPERGSQRHSCAGVLGVCRGGVHMCCLLLSTRW